MYTNHCINTSTELFPNKLISILLNWFSLTRTTNFAALGNVFNYAAVGNVFNYAAERLPPTIV